MNDSAPPVAARIDAAQIQDDANLHVQVGAPVKRFHLWVQGPAWVLCFTMVALGSAIRKWCQRWLRLASLGG